LYNAHINPYSQASYLNVDSTRQRRLLLHRRQIRQIEQEVAQKALAIVPLRVYFNERGIAKIEIALCKGKKLYDRREDVKKREYRQKDKTDIKKQKQVRIGSLTREKI